MPYHVAVFRAIINKGYQCVVYWWGRAPKTSYRAPKIERLIQVNRFDFSDARSLYQDASKWSPVCVVCNGWMDRGYNSACAMFKRSGIPTLAVSDTQWRGGKQWLNRLFSPFRHKRYFDYIWAAGLLQYDYARKLGYDSSHILLNCFSADTEVFSRVSLDDKRNIYPRRFLYVGRFVEVKGIDTMLKAWESIVDKRGWTLELVGDGPLKETFRRDYPNVIIKDFMPQSDLAIEAANSGCFILPSHFEPWALVIQEFASAAMPIVCTRKCGAAYHFVLNGYNGYVVEADDVAAMVKAMQKIIKATDMELITMSEHSRQLSQAVTPEFVADTLLSIL
ncbi:glycosyl transferase group 1 [Phocaeicola salanitronis DSM 18170]|uniref:Glycosyl transferase group 1 n=2 Tax=Phocaeicola salanitronis TaxID=376805 RepID=F0R0E8_PHOSB|nr:glycosyl transferase group 1 [Phocaeicola salanitronis DSM 18170]